MAHYANLGHSVASFNQMIQRFGVVTVMNAKVYDANTFNFLGDAKSPYDIVQEASRLNPICTLDTLKIANVTLDGPTKTISGGQYSNPLIKFGKSGRLEMQDALGNAKAIEALCGGIVEYKQEGGDITGLHVGEDFAGAKTIIGDSFFINQKTGAQVPVVIIFYQFLPDSLFNLTQDAEGDATVFDMNGDLLTTQVMLGTTEGQEMAHGVFYSILDPNEGSESSSLWEIATDGTLTIASGYTATVNSVDVNSGTTKIAEGTSCRLVIKKGDAVILSTVISR